MAKLTLVASPTFKCKVAIPVAGGPSVDVEFVFKHRTKDALDELIKTRAEQSDADTVMAVIAGWDLEDSFDRTAVELLLQNYIGASLAIYREYVDQLVQAKAKN